MGALSFFEIQASDPNALVAFYGAVFGWKFEQDEALPIEYCRIDGAGVNGGLLKRPAPPPPGESGTNAFTCSFEVDDFDGAAMTIANKGGIVALPKFAVPGVCWQGYFIDPDNNTFGIFQVDDNAH